MRDLSFYGQDDTLQVLQKTFQTAKRIVLAGKEGNGKSTLARTYIQRFGQEYRAIAWLNAATEETLLADLCGVLHEFALPVDIALGAMGLFQTLHDYLNEQQQALLVLDHLPFAFGLQESFEQLPLFYNFLLITHLEQTPPELPRLELTGLNAQYGALLLLHRAGLLAEQEPLDALDNPLRAAALELAREMQGSPLVLRLVGGYLRQNGINLQDYLDLFRAYPVNLNLHKNEQQALEVVCELCLAWLEKTHPAAGEILQMCALLLPDAIPGGLVQSDEEAKIAHQNDTIQLLVSMGLLDANENTAVLSMHPLIQQLVIQFYKLDEYTQPPQQAARLLLRLHDLLPTLEGETLSTRLRMVGHIQQLGQWSKSWQISAPEAAEVFGWAARQLWEKNVCSSQAEALLRKALEIWEKAPGVSQETIATALEKLAALNSQLENLAEAEALAHRAITSKIAARGINHPDVLVGLIQLGQYYMAQNKDQEAKACYEKALEMAETLKLRLNPVYSMAKYNLALLYMKQRKFEQAEDLLRRVCVVWSHILGQSNRSTVEARFKLAEVAALLKHWEQAYKYYRQALSAYAEALETENPLLPGHQAWAAMVMFQLGKFEEARNAWQSILTAQEQKREGTPTERIDCLNGLALIALVEGKREEALDLLEQAQQHTAELAETEVLVRAELLETQARAHEAGQEYEQAERAARKALEMREQLVGSESLELIETLSELARFNLALGKEENATNFLLRALYNYQQEQKPDDMRLDPVLQSLALLEMRHRRFDMARIYQQRVQAIRAAALGEDHPRTREIEEKLAEIAHVQSLRG